MRRPESCDTRETRNQRGSALVMVVLLAMVATALGGTMLMMSNIDHRLAANERDAERALFASRAGLNYGFHLFDEELVLPTEAGAPFDSFASAVSAPLRGAEFAGRLSDLSAAAGRGQLYRISSTGTYGTASRSTELVFQIVPDALKFGYMAFNEATLHNHSGLAGPTFRIQSTIMSNGSVSIPESLTIDGSVVASGPVSVKTDTTVNGNIFANAVDNSGTINGDVRLLTSVVDLPADAATWDRVDAYGAKYAWFNGNDTPGSYGGGGTLAGSSSSYTVANDDVFRADIFSRTGNLLANPDVNVTRYIPPPLLDYQAMKAEADLNDPTYFTSQEAALTYFATKKVVETIGGRTVTTIRVGTPSAPEFIYIDDDFQMTLEPGGGDDPAGGTLDADALYIEGGLYITGSFDFDGPNFIDPSPNPPYPPPPDYYMLSIRALDHCYPALLAYGEPGTGTLASWTPDDTPPIGGGSSIKMNAGGDEGPSLFDGLVFAQSDIHMHHTSDPREVIRFNGAELAWKIHNCDYFWFSYDPDVRCTRFLVTSSGEPEVVSFREVR